MLLLGALASGWGVTSARGQIIRRGLARENLLPAEIDGRTGDTVAVILLREVYKFNRKRFGGPRHEQQYWRMVNDVKKTLPIAQHARRLLVHSYDTLQFLDDRAERAYFKQMERDLWQQYKPQLKRLNYRQGRLLVRLIDRECNKQSYAIIKEFMGTRKALFWQAFGSCFGVSLKSEWDPDGKDKELEDICIQVEQGLL